MDLPGVKLLPQTQDHNVCVHTWSARQLDVLEYVFPASAPFFASVVDESDVSTLSPVTCMGG